MLTIRSDRQVMTFDVALGGRVISWRVDGREVLAGIGDHPIEHGLYPMAPWAGRLRRNRITREQCAAWGIDADLANRFEPNYQEWALHGTALTTPVTVANSHGDSAVTLRCPLPEWPAELVMHWQLDGLVARSTITMEATRSTPALMGWHPWFPMFVNGVRATWALHGSLAVREGAFPTGALIPWEAGSARVDDAFRVPDGVVELHWGGVHLRITNSDPWFVVYDQRDDALCIEPQSGPPNALELPFEEAPPIARPDAARSMSTTWSWIRPT
jgi:aldose 1-epimerase